MKAGRKRILAVDDQRIALEIFEGMLGKEFEVACAESGEDALKLVNTFKPDLIVLDAVMPGLDGWKVCRKLKSDPETCHIKIVMISAHAILPEHHEAARTAGADDFITKPMIHQELISRVMRALRK